MVKALDPKGNPVAYEAGGLLSVVLQHEIDHLDGVLMTDRAVDPRMIRPIAERESLTSAEQRYQFDN